MAEEPYLIVILRLWGQWVVGCGGCRREVARVDSKGEANRVTAEHCCGAAA
jgi:hypothetical protein